MTTTAKALLNPHLARLRRTLARSTVFARFAARLRNQLHGIVVEHLGHDIDMERNGELWILRKLAPGCRVFVDVGANVGDWSASFLSLSAEAEGWLLEPSDTAAAKLEVRFKGNPRVHVRRAAASDQSGVVSFFEEPDAGHTSSLVPGFSRQATTRSVPATTLDALMAAEGISHADYVKIDAEGHDLHVLRGAREALAADRIGALQFEYNRPWQQAGSTLAGAFALLEDVGYRPFLLKGPRLYRLPYEVYGEFFHYANFVAFPDSRVAKLTELIGGTI